MKFIHAMLVVTAVTLVLGGAQAQTFPSKPIRLVVAYPPGGAADVLARAITPKAGELLGQQIIIENQGGAGGKIGAQAVARAAPDGHTLLLTAIGSHVLSLFDKEALNHPIKDFSPITHAVESVLFIPYKGGAQATIDMLAGQVPLVLQPVVTFLPHVKSGKARILAVMLPKRWEEMPDVPTIQEIVPGFEKAPGGIGIWGPAALPPAIATRLQAALASGLRQPEIAERLKSQGMIPMGNTPAEFAREINEGVVINQRLVKASGVEIR